MGQEQKTAKRLLSSEKEKKTAAKVGGAWSPSSPANTPASHDFNRAAASPHRPDRGSRRHHGRALRPQRLRPPAPLQRADADVGHDFGDDGLRPSLDVLRRRATPRALLPSGRGQFRVQPPMEPPSVLLAACIPPRPLSLAHVTLTPPSVRVPGRLERQRTRAQRDVRPCSILSVCRRVGDRRRKVLGGGRPDGR